MKLIWAVLCRSASVDSSTNNISLFEVLEEVEVGFMDGGPPPVGAHLTTGVERPGQTSIAAIPFELVTLWRRDPEGEALGKFRVRVLSTDGTSVGQTPDIEIAWHEHLRHRSRARFAAVPLPVPGTTEEFEFVVELAGAGKKWRKVAGIPLLVRYRQPIEPPRRRIRAKARKAPPS